KGSRGADSVGSRKSAENAACFAALSADSASSACASEIDLPTNLQQPSLENTGRPQERVGGGRRERRVDRTHPVAVERVVDAGVAAQAIPADVHPLRKP